ncbi:MAG: RNA polymerase sigma factor [Planctomycetota bacterium]|jgi:RNA polymerase sigma-70 factor (ECF subfamily)
MTQLTDRNLVDAHLSGDPQAFESLVSRHGPSVLGYLTKMTHNRDRAEDIFQDTFRRVHEKADQFRGESLRPWIFKIASNAAVNEYRKEKRTAAVSLSQSTSCEDGHNCPTLENTLAADTDSPDDQLAQQDQRKQVRESLLKLPEKQRSALILSYYHKMTYKEIAEAMDCSVSSVKTHLFRALKKLATILPNPAVEGLE